MIVTLLTDFGTADSYVAEMKAVLLSRALGVTLVDISHQVAPGDIRAGQYLLGRAWKHFPAGTVHLAIVDPGVGTARRAIAAEHEGHRFVAPDNGLLSFLPQDGRFVSLPVSTTAAATFHGRDVFAPAAARLATGGGTSLGELGESSRVVGVQIGVREGSFVRGDLGLQPFDLGRQAVVIALVLVG